MSCFAILIGKQNACGVQNHYTIFTPMKPIYLILLLTILTVACNNNGISTNADGEKIFTYEPLSWEITLPQGWEILTEVQRDKLAYAAQNYYEEDTQNSNETGEKKIILGVRKAEKDMNSCYAFIRSYNRNEDYPELRDLLNQQKRAYSTDAYSAEAVLTEETLSGIPFEKAVLTVQYREQPYFTYTTYSAMLDTLNFGVSIVTNNKEDEQMLTAHFRKSVASIKKP